MRLVVADTSPINYLILIGHIDILPALFDKVILPGTVKRELAHPKAPLAVQSRIADPQERVDIRWSTEVHIHDASLELLDAGESAFPNIGL